MAQQVTTDPSAQQTPPERLRMSFDEFQDWYGEGRRGEWVDGEVIPFLAPKTIHLRISRFLTVLIDMYATDQGLGEVLPTPELRLRAGRSYREPDLAFVAAAHASRVTADGIDGPADLVIELVSEDSVRRDRREKFAEYEAAGIQEYWVVDPRPLRKTFIAYALTDEGYYDPIQPDPTGRVVSAVLPGMWIDPSWLWEEPLPDPRDKLAEIRSMRVLS